MRAPWARSGQYLHGWAGSLQMVSEPIPDLDVGVCSVWPRNPMGHNEDVVSAWPRLSHPTSDRGETSCHYISMGSSQPCRRVLKP